VFGLNIGCFALALTEQFWQPFWRLLLTSADGSEASGVRSKAARSVSLELTCALLLMFTSSKPNHAGLNCLTGRDLFFKSEVGGRIGRFQRDAELEGE